ncbi:hypothetical protein [Burkholderia multivorans]|uniref:hypothetical protein n=1 Tax=Burkholderia multivorans TaxID=87883 RepID=UPI0021BE1CCF|nr:hypothetical protein [Burkholderia multivorans]
MSHADWLVQRIFMPDSLTTLQHLPKLLIGESMQQILPFDPKRKQIFQTISKEAIA